MGNCGSAGFILWKSPVTGIFLVGGFAILLRLIGCVFLVEEGVESAKSKLRDILNCKIKNESIGRLADDKNE